ncbi:MAG: TIGR02253 family HAD-type hydrolase [Candidatus Aenigmarchaeota archaeon]|nr:TIGR02253 family HAD-type hydrolase [Candidatus Aenigmarchaeota archaeon]NIQ17537.1 TIGR02253 family HAD-type hydrolase [Candidatus Aenigmarchaeota archaeon]NIS73115.1 TIGR02253 family HAD-type hydrolase [Candidatus Aenigmarchaeota archaeon]
MIEAVLFDLDNTLIDFMLMKRKSCEAAVDAMVSAGLKISRRKAMDILFDLYGEKGIEYNRIFQEFLKKTIGKIDYKILAKGVVAYRKAQIAYVKPYPGTVKILLRLKQKGMKLGIVSDAPSVNAWIRLVEMGIEDFFDVIVTLSDTGKEKPSKIPFLEAVKKIGVKPGNILFVGDRPGRDIKGAKAAGMKTVFAKYGNLEGIKKSGADYEIEKIEDLLKVV